MTTSELLQPHLPESHAVKAFDNILASHVVPLHRPGVGHPERSVLVIVGNDDAAKGTATRAHRLDRLRHLRPRAALGGMARTAPMAASPSPVVWRLTPVVLVPAQEAAVR